MALAHPIHPKSAFAQELREERAKGISQGITQGITQGLTQGAQQKQLEVIERMLSKGSTWDFITDVTGMNKQEFDTLRSN